MAEAFKAEALSKNYGRRRVLDGLNLVIEPGETIGLLGSNGSGKTTFLKTLLGLLTADGGRSAIAAEPSQALSAAARARIGYVPLTPNQFAWLNCRAMLRYLGAFYPKFDWTYTSESITKAATASKAIGRVRPVEERRATISQCGSEQQTKYRGP
jgi:ABC-2 type transport system ATP-binding protein